jgi:hypothetical protein
MEKRIRRVRLPAERIVMPAAEKVKMELLLKSIAEIEHETEVLTAERTEKVAKLLKLMQVYKRTTVEVEEAVAERITSMGRSSSRIDPIGFHDLVEEEDFFACIDVVKGRAEKVLSGKELDSITETTPGKKGEEVLKIKRR